MAHRTRSWRTLDNNSQLNSISFHLQMKIKQRIAGLSLVDCTLAITEKRPEKISGFEGIRTHA